MAILANNCWCIYSIIIIYGEPSGDTAIRGAGSGRGVFARGGIHQVV